MEKYLTERGEELRSLNEDEFEPFVEILGKAYPAMKIFTPESKEATKKRMVDMEKDTRIHHYGLFRDGVLLGGMRFFDFTMKLLSIKTGAGGVGSVAVGMLYKKQKVAFHLIKFFLDYYHAQDIPIVTLYPFRPDFYKKMGFGYGTKISRYSVKPASLPAYGRKSGVSFLGKSAEDEKLFVDCYNRYLDATNGLNEKNSGDMAATFHNNELVIAGYRAEGQDQLDGYVSFTFKNVHAENFVHNDIIVKELVYNSSEALLGLLAFLQSQADQINRVIFNIQDSYFHHVLLDPRNGTDVLIPPVSHESNIQGTGIMYRITDTKRVFELLANHDFGEQTLKLKLDIADSFYPQNAGPLVVYFENGLATVQPETASYDTAISLDIADFSSLLVGSVEFRTLHRYGLATISDTRYLGAVNRVFQPEMPPMCMSLF
ncbi:MAG: GNAT family N-acetyltransferase [Chloroflexi bacterium]|nr:GNAT family N-acetyltransferase [Chloroflexota bacterium]OJV97534.1 MAG: hypothetical protein BGO39_07135 [Chloroflexi bacterium 54-19]